MAEIILFKKGGTSQSDIAHSGTNIFRTFREDNLSEIKKNDVGIKESDNSKMELNPKRSKKESESHHRNERQERQEKHIEPR